MNQLFCPRCKNEALSSALLEKGLATESCQKCQGHWLLIENFVMWKANHTGAFAEKDEQSIKLEDNAEHKKVLLCPYTGKMMQRFFIHHTLEKRLNFSPSLSGIWLDGGDWELLKSLNLALELNRIFTTNWQNTIRQQQLDASLEQRYCQRLGEEDFAKLKDFRDWLYAHPEKEMMMAYVMNNNTVSNNN